MKKSLILATSFAMALGVGVAVGAHHMKEVAKKAEATGPTLYCTMTHSWWKTDGAAVGIYAWNGTGADKNAEYPGVRMDAVAGETDMWTATLGKSYEKVIFTRVNGSGSISDWGAKTKDLTIPTDGKNHFTITSESAVWGDPGCEGNWSTYTPPAVASTYSYSLNGGEDVEMTPSGNEVISVSRSFEVGDELTFKKDSAAYAVTAKDDDAYTKVEVVDNKLVFVQDYTGVLYLNTSSAKLWAGELDRGYYLNGSFSPEWNVKHALKASEKEGEEGTFEIKGLTVADDAEVKFMQFVNNQKEPNYVNIDGEKLTIGGGIDAGLTEGNNLKFNKGGTYDFYLNTTNNNWLTVNDPSYVPPEPDDPAEDGYYLVGTKTNWKYAGATKLAAGENGNRAQLINYPATAGEQFKVRSRLETVDTWYGWGDSHDQNYVVGESNKQLDVYVNGDGYLWVQEHVEPDVPAADGYYLLGSKTDYKYAGAPEVPELAEPDEDNNVAILLDYDAKEGEKYKVKYYNESKGQNDWGSTIAVEGLGTLDEDGNFVMSKDAHIDIFVKWEQVSEDPEVWAMKFYIAEHAERYNVTFKGLFYEGKDLEKTINVVDTQRATEKVNFEVKMDRLAQSGYVLRGVYTDNTFEHEYTATKLAGATELFVKYTKSGYYMTGDETFLGEGHGWNVDYSEIIEENATGNRFEGTITVPTGVDADHPMLVKPLHYEGQDNEGKTVWASAYYEMGINPDTEQKWEYSFASVDGDGNFKFVKPGTYAFYVYDTNKVTFNSGEYAFHAAFLSQVGGECKNDGSTDTAALKVIWGNMKTAYNALDKDDRDAIYAVGFDGGDEDSGDDRLRMIAKYNYIVTKYGTAEFEDFIWGKTIAPKVGNNVMILKNSTNTGLIIIISVSAISVISIAAFLMLKKRKEK